ncbi:large ribosomal subunit protein mL55 [Parasteatoda tepidariorum]|uniref:large ribosomal subunit protein mL55 n=1 Tax=Parasteatoda tepidariorum TaxID=114398 RepID=UPI00077F92E3|nr:39S ribosomal protein L55, mitochondrial [Parasteatoda tepidariorum]XP_042913592.1 39S ribosomal protein L55, mitochondrial-like [Parasteatoda tepidariorum]
MSRVLCKSVCFIWEQVRNGSNRTCIAKIGREKYVRVYPTMVVNSDGSTYTIRYHEPRKIIKLPMDTSKLTAEELHIHLNRRKGIKKVVIEEQFEDDFDINRYSHLWKDKSTENK